MLIFVLLYIRWYNDTKTTNVCTVCFSMSAKGFRNLLQYISTLDKPHRERIYYELQHSIFPSSASIRVIDELRDKRYAKGFTCAHCKSCSVVVLANIMVVNDINVKIAVRLLAT